MMKISNRKFSQLELPLLVLVFSVISPQFTIIKIKLLTLKPSNNSKKLGVNLSVTLKSSRASF